MRATVISVGPSKTGGKRAGGLPLRHEMGHRARKCGLMGIAALDMAYVACGRFDAYIEQGISLWDVAAGWILVETAGGSGEVEARPGIEDRYSIFATKGVIDFKLWAAFAAVSDTMRRASCPSAKSFWGALKLPTSAD